MTDNNVSTLSTIFFIGIGGIGMSAIARYFLYHGHRVVATTVWTPFYPTGGAWCLYHLRQ